MFKSIYYKCNCFARIKNLGVNTSKKVSEDCVETTLCSLISAFVSYCLKSILLGYRVQSDQNICWVLWVAKVPRLVVVQAAESSSYDPAHEIMVLIT